jgi:UDP-N-acetyl-2-amino-2-deoxyglucuronate dehydrogenase
MAGKGTLGVGVVGCGTIGRLHLRAMRDLPGVRVAALSSRRPAEARAVGEQEGCAWTTSVEELVGRADVDIVTVATSSGSHAPIALAAIAAGKHVLIEKPMAMTPDDARRIIAAAAARPVVLGVVSQRRFEDVHRTVKPLIDAGALGKLLLLEAFCPYFRTQEYYDTAKWRGTVADDGGALMNQAIHAVDLLLWFGGPAREVYGRVATQTHRIEAEDLAVGVIGFDNGALGSIMASTCIRPGFQAALNLYGERGSIKLEGATVVHWSVPGVAPPPATSTASTGVASPALASDEHHRAQIADFVAAVQTERAPAVTGHDGLRAVELVHGLYRAAAERRPVALTA